MARKFKINVLLCISRSKTSITINFMFLKHTHVTESVTTDEIVFIKHATWHFMHDYLVSNFCMWLSYPLSNSILWNTAISKIKEVFQMIRVFNHYDHFGPIVVPKPLLWDIYNFGEGQPLPNIHFLSINSSLKALNTMLFKYFTDKYYMPSLIQPWSQNLYPGDNDFQFGISSHSTDLCI